MRLKKTRYLRQIFFGVAGVESICYLEIHCKFEMQFMALLGYPITTLYLLTFPIWDCGPLSHPSPKPDSVSIILFSNISIFLACPISNLFSFRTYNRGTCFTNSLEKKVEKVFSQKMSAKSFWFRCQTEQRKSKHHHLLMLKK